MRIVAAMPAAGLLAGAALGLFLSDSHPAADRGAAAAAWLTLAASLGAAAYAWRAKRPTLLAAMVAFGFFAGGVRLASVAWQRAWRPPLREVFERLAREERAYADRDGRRMTEDDEAFAIVEGELRTDASPGESGTSLSVDVGRIGAGGRPFTGRELREAGPNGPPHDDIRTSGGIIVTVVGSLAASRLDDWRAGRRVRFPVTLRRPSRYYDPGVPDNERALARRGTTLVGSVKSGALVEVTARGSAWMEAIAATRAFARRAIAGAVGGWSPRSAAIVAAIVIGDRAGLDPDVQRKLQDAGTYHVIAISGGNIAILAGLLIAAFRIAGWLGRAAMLSAMLVLIAYAQLVGGGASVDRATLMAVVYFGGRAFDQRSPPLNALAVVAALLVAADPLAVADPAFLLTFGATLAILVVVPHLGGPSRRAPDSSPGGLRRSPGTPTGGGLAPAARAARARAVLERVLRQFVGLFAASIAVEALLFPVGAMVFSRVTFAGLALNFLAIPLMGVAQIAGMAVVPIALASPAAARLVGWVAHLGAAGLVGSADFVRFAPILTYRLAPPAAAAVSLYYPAVAAWWILRRRRIAVTGSLETLRARLLRRTCLVAAIATGLWILIDPRTVVASRGDGRLHVTFLDVGQGDSIFVVFPRGSALLVDAGGLSPASSFDIGDRVVAPVIRAAGFRRLDVLALTHGDPDHIGGAGAIVGEFRPREVWEGIPVPRFEPLAVLKQRAEASGARWSSVHAGESRSIDGVDVFVRHPPVAEWERQKVRNDDSIVLELRYRDVSVLLTGDIGRTPERAIAPAIPPARLRVVKIPHHGSLTSSTPEFVKALHPAIAIVSAGRANHFGHPVPEVLDRYTSGGAEIFRTDRDGAVTVEIDGSDATVKTFTGRTFSGR